MKCITNNRSQRWDSGCSTHVERHCKDAGWFD